MYVFIQSAACPKAISLITINLVERLSNRYATAFQLDVYQRESVHQNCHIVTVVMLCSLSLGDFVLVNDLQKVVVDVFLINEGNILGRTIVSTKHLYIVFLNLSGFLYNALVLVCKRIFKKAFPLVVRKGKVVQLFQLRPQVGDKVALFMERQTLVSLFCQHLEESFFQIMLGLVAAGLPLLRFVFCHNGVFCGLCHKVKKGHGVPLLSGKFRERKQPIPIVFVLLLSGFDFCRQTSGHIVAEGFKAVKDRNDFLSFFLLW